jgi:preprotein translocase subunit SecA
VTTILLKKKHQGGTAARGQPYDPVNIELVHHVLQAVKAHALFRKTSIMSLRTEG